jgi:DNA-directed RNA polymerase subunit RPC12/RpoP
MNTCVICGKEFNPKELQINSYLEEMYKEQIVCNDCKIINNNKIIARKLRKK